ncbi:MAG: lipoyl synthase [Candidatus Ratteibacteria bacterium]|nr:lipoyl synthase [Candidatus Ratteibacteria bacterium]
MKDNLYRKTIILSETGEIKKTLRELKLHSVCEESRCPNISECFRKKTTTFLILGDVCTRNCRFCSVKKGIPLPVDEKEPERVAEAVYILGMEYVVITSVTRDDLPDGGSGMFRKTVEEIRKAGFSGRIELLIPDFAGDEGAIETVLTSFPDVISHNIETPLRLYPVLRDRANYHRSLDVLKKIKKLNPQQKTKSGIMLGLGETEGEIIDTLKDIVDTGCDFCSIGQYLAPSKGSYPVQRYFTSDEFEYYRERALSFGFRAVKSGIYVRTSYNASSYL